jgi:hypothetical protein
MRHKLRSPLTIRLRGLSGKQVRDVDGSAALRNRTGCQCDAKIVNDTTTVSLWIANAHTTEDHEEEQDIRVLSHKQKCLVAAAVKVAPMQTAKQLLQILTARHPRS